MPARFSLIVQLLLTVSFGCGAVGQLQAAERREDLTFGNVVLGDTATQAVFVTVNTGGNEFWMRLYDPSAPFVNTTPNAPVQIADEYAFIFEFNPLVGQGYVDSTALVRFEDGFPIDTIYVTMVGEGLSLTAEATFDYPWTMTGDFIIRSGEFYGPAFVVDHYRVVNRPSAPFVTSLVNDKPTFVAPDSIRVSVAFEPVSLGTYTDSLVMVRHTESNVPLDTLTVTLQATSVEMKPDTTVQFTGVTIGSVDTLNVFTRLPGFFVVRNFQYELEQLDPGPMSGEVDPDRPTRRTVITNRIIAAPTQFSNVRQRFMLRRKSVQTDEVWDSTLIKVDLLMAPRPVRFSVRWDQKPVNARIGDTVSMELQAVTNDAFDVPLQITDLTGDLYYNPTVFVPVPSAGQQRSVENDSVRWTIGLPEPQIESSGPVTTLATLRAVIALGDSDHSPLILRNVSIQANGGTPRSLPPDTNRLNITNVFRYADGTPRYINPMQGALVLSVSPNPVPGDGTLTIDQVPDGRGALEIIDVMGQVVQDLSADVRAGIRSWTVSSGGGADVLVLPGSYYARLTVQGTQPNSVARVVRLFIVQ